MQKHKYLLTYRYAEIIHDLTVQFCHAYLMGNLSALRNLSLLGAKPDTRTVDQMNQSARSGKQNIVEGASGSDTSKSGEIKLLGVAKMSQEELLADYEDFLRQHSFEIFSKADSRITTLRQEAYRLTDISNLSDLGDLKERPKLSGNPEADANFLLTLCHQVTFLLDKQIKSCISRFEINGGINEKLYQLRKKHSRLEW
jgi:four helix bundle suffix protein